MRTLLLVLGVLIALGMIFARDRVKRAFQLGAALYAIVLVARLLLYGLGDNDNLFDLLTIVAVFFLIWAIAWAGTQAVLRYRERTGRPRS